MRSKRLVLAKSLVESGVAASTSISMTLDPRKVINLACHTGFMSALKQPAGITLEPTRGFAITLIWTGILGWFAAFSLVLERIHVATNPDATLSCDLNPFISCKSVMLTPQASLFGFPNPLIGLAAFVAPIAVGVAILAGAKFAAWFWRIFAVGITGGFLFVLWLWVQSTFVIGVLCPYCMVAWAAMVPLFWKVILFGTKDGFIDTPLRFVDFFDRAYDKSWVFTLVTEAIVIAVIIVRFWSMWPALWS
jgi:uncharacterized membrane protein